MASRNARSRMIYWKISYCKQLSRCSLIANILFTWLIPNTDDLGRMEGDPEIIKGMMFPYHENIGIKEIASALKELQDENLIIWYKVEDNLYIQLPNFSTYQKLRTDRTYTSDYPSLNDNVGNRQDKSCHVGQNMGEVKISEAKISEANISEEKGSEVDNSLPPLEIALDSIIHTRCPSCKSDKDCFLKNIRSNATQCGSYNPVEVVDNA